VRCKIAKALTNEASLWNGVRLIQFQRAVTRKTDC
jgi:hypothetical protein